MKRGTRCWWSGGCEGCEGCVCLVQKQWAFNFPCSTRSKHEPRTPTPYFNLGIHDLARPRAEDLPDVWVKGDLSGFMLYFLFL